MTVARFRSSGASRLAAAVADADAKISWTQLRIGVDGRAGWLSCADLAGDPDRLRRWQDDTADAYGNGATDPAITAAGLVLDWYLAAVTLPAAAAFSLGRVVPDLALDRVALLPGPPGSPVAATALLSVEPATAHPDAEAMAGQLRAHARAFLAAYAPLTRFGPRTTWAAATDAMDTAFLTAGWVSDDPGVAAADAARVLGTGPERCWRRGAGWSTLHQLTDHGGRQHWTRRRHGCCFLYRLDGVAACPTCPRVSDAERARLAVSWD